MTLQFEEDVRYPVPLNYFIKPTDDVPEFVLIYVLQELKDRHGIAEGDARSAIGHCGLLMGNTKIDDEELDATIQGTFSQRLERVLQLKNLIRKYDSSRYSVNGVLQRFDYTYLYNNGKYSYDVHYDVDWQAGDFGDGGSCWWSYASISMSRVHFRHMCYKGEAFALRLYSSCGNGCGRAFGLWYKDYPVVFNAVGEIPMCVAPIMFDLLGGDTRYASVYDIYTGLDLHVHSGAMIFGTMENKRTIRIPRWSDYKWGDNPVLEQERLQDLEQGERW